MRITPWTEQKMATMYDTSYWRGKLAELIARRSSTAAQIQVDERTKLESQHQTHEHKTGTHKIVIEYTSGDTLHSQQHADTYGDRPHTDRRSKFTGARTEAARCVAKRVGEAEAAARLTYDKHKQGQQS